MFDDDCEFYTNPGRVGSGFVVTIVFSFFLSTKDTKRHEDEIMGAFLRVL